MEEEIKELKGLIINLLDDNDALRAELEALTLRVAELEE